MVECLRAVSVVLFVSPRVPYGGRQKAQTTDGAFEGSEQMAGKKKTDPEPFETVEPIGARVLIRKDEDKKQTKGGIQLPDNIEIPTITGRIVTISAEVEHCEDIPLRQYDKVLFNPKNAIPVDFEGTNRLFVVDVENVVAVFRKQ